VSGDDITTRGEFGGSETFTGHQGLARAAEMFRAAWARMTARVIKLIDGEHVVVAVINFELQSRTGVHLEVEEAWTHWLRDGKIVRIEQHGAVQQALHAADLSP
jgi:ketosteroid isomerase-like protein